jgi:predicted amidohydrolase YtcJ
MGSGPRHHIAHLQLVAEPDIRRFADLGVTANLQMYWAADDEQVRTLCRPLLGDDRVERQYPFADLLRAGAPLAAGSDWPVSTASVLAQVQVAVTRRPATEPDIAPLGPEQALDVDTALAACTIGGAALHGRQAAIRPGAAADLALLGADPYRVPATEIGVISVRATIAAGQVVFAP